MASITPTFSDVPRRISDQVADTLRREIYSGRLLPGQRLLEIELTERFGISRSPFREALLALQQDRLIELRPHRGAVVVRFTEDDIREICDLRVLLEPRAAVAAASGTDGSIAQIEEAYQAYVDLAEFGRDILSAAIAHADLHRSIANASKLPRLASFLNMLGTQWLAVTAIAAIQKKATYDLDLHANVVEAIKVRRPKRAEQAMRAHFKPIDSAIEAYRLLLERADEEA
ncbi:MAG: hypothetical protein V7607_5664 [Solirubrobacteraceae bacterium]